MMEKMTKASSVYKWAHKGAGVIQSGFATLSTNLLIVLLSCWHRLTTLASICRQKYPPIAALETYVRTSWNSLCSAMAIEVVAAPQPVKPIGFSDSPRPEHTTAILPVLRLNSVEMEDVYGTSSGSKDDPAEFLSSDCDSGLVFTDADENELSSDDAGFRDEVDASRVPPQEPYGSRRDSDSSDISSDGLEEGKGTQEVTDKLINQVESMFSDDHLAKDGFLLKHVRRRSDGFVSLKLVAGLRKVKQISRDFPTVLTALKESKKLEVNPEGTKIRRTEALTPQLKSLPVGGTKEKENKGFYSNGASSDSAQDDRVMMRNGFNGYRRNQRNNSIISTGSSGSSRNGSFCKSGHEPLYRNMMVYMPDENPQVMRRHRGGSLPMPNIMSHGGQQHYFRPPLEEPSLPPQRNRQKRNSLFVGTTTSHLDASNYQVRPKSNSYCEGIGPRTGAANGGTSLWLQRRMESTRASEGTLALNGILRQPRGPDGTRGFAAGSRRSLTVI